MGYKGATDPLIWRITVCEKNLLRQTPEEDQSIVHHKGSTNWLPNQLQTNTTKWSKKEAKKAIKTAVSPFRISANVFTIPGRPPHRFLVLLLVVTGPTTQKNRLLFIYAHVVLLLCEISIVIRGIILSHNSPQGPPPRITSWKLYSQPVGPP